MNEADIKKLVFVSYLKVIGFCVILALLSFYIGDFFDLKEKLTESSEQFSDMGLIIMLIIFNLVFTLPVYHTKKSELKKGDSDIESKNEEALQLSYKFGAVISAFYFISWIGGKMVIVVAVVYLLLSYSMRGGSQGKS